ncbi:MAG: hypothetical protein HQ509_12210 [Candidatus Marinimicrobia bacterium]|nr:hypothetical protein [Candidatus Neomarinimicrobiota bacterium]
MKITLNPFSRIKMLVLTTVFVLSFLSAIPFRTYGYFDLEFEVNNKDRAGKIWTFDQHHLNIINIFSLDQNFRLFTEMEWEHGISIEADGAGSGKIYLAQGWLEYKKSNALRFQMGKILVPFGKYGLTYDATPTFLSTFLPNSVYGNHENSVGYKDRLFAKWLTGVQVAGLIPLGDWATEYFFYITNGRGPKPSEKDTNPNKGLGGRIIVRTPIDDMIFGFSYYSDADGNSHNTIQTSFGTDFEFTVANLTFEAEGVYKNGQNIDTTTIQPIDDYLTGYGYYFQTSYTIKDRWTPFVRIDQYDPDINGKVQHDETTTVGINVSITPRIYFKSEFQFSRDADHLLHDNDTNKAYQSFISSIAVAF